MGLGLPMMGQPDPVTIIVNGQLLVIKVAVGDIYINVLTLATNKKCYCHFSLSPIEDLCAQDTRNSLPKHYSVVKITNVGFLENFQIINANKIKSKYALLFYKIIEFGMNRV